VEQNQERDGNVKALAHAFAQILSFFHGRRRRIVAGGEADTTSANIAVRRSGAGRRRSVVVAPFRWRNHPSLPLFNEDYLDFSPHKFASLTLSLAALRAGD
jgi:hypothetical protein